MGCLRKPGKWGKGPHSLEFFADAQSIWGPGLQQHCLAWHFWKVLKIPPGKGAGRQPAFLCPARALVEKQPLFLPCETPLWCLEDPPLHERKGVVFTPALEWEEGASGKLGKANWSIHGGESKVHGGLARPLVSSLGTFSFKRVYLHWLASRPPEPTPTSPSLDSPVLRSGFPVS